MAVRKTPAKPTVVKLRTPKATTAARTTSKTRTPLGIKPGK